MRGKLRRSKHVKHKDDDDWIKCCKTMDTDVDGKRRTGHPWKTWWEWLDRTPHSLSDQEHARSSNKWKLELEGGGNRLIQVLLLKQWLKQFVVKIIGNKNTADQECAQLCSTFLWGLVEGCKSPLVNSIHTRVELDEQRRNIHMLETAKQHSRSNTQCSERCKHCTLAVVRRSQNFLPCRRPLSQGHGTAKI